MGLDSWTNQRKSDGLQDSFGSAHLAHISILVPIVLWHVTLANLNTEAEHSLALLYMICFPLLPQEAPNQLLSCCQPKHVPSNFLSPRPFILILSASKINKNKK